MIPITRKELYLNKIVGNNDYETPEKPLTPEEFFFAAILGEAVQTPEPLSRYQIYLAKIAGRNISVPKPLTRLELFLAKACGMDIETPTPITREEIFWSNYSAIVDFELEGVPPLTYKAIEGTLENYRIYGNTVDGESVGDLVTSGEHAGEYKVPVTVSNGTDTLITPIYLPEQIKKVGDEAEYIDYAEQKQHRVRKNLFDVSTITPDCYVDDEGQIIRNDGIDTSNFIKVSPNTNYTYKGVVIYNTNTIRIAYYDQSKNFISRHFIIGNAVDGETVTAPSNCEYVKLSYDKVITYLMLNSGSTSLPYEPYIENVDLDVTLPALPTLTGTNVLSVGTAVQPSKVYIKGEKGRE